ncbi:hypothetical protein [Micromonospora ureilytica]|uniref:hypothetical protein n=1 Tax=Micromonospora ureilytica TaxID=709868 RepID=UPI00403A7BA0
MAVLALVAPALLATTLSQPASAEGADPATGPGTVVIKSEPGVVTVTIPDPSVKTKSQAASTVPTQPQLAAYVGNNSASHCSINVPPCKFNIFKTSSRTITPPGGSSGALQSSGTALVDVYTVTGCCFTKADYYNTNSYSQWGGTSPFNASSVKHEDIWDIDYLGVGFSFGGSPSGTINLGSGRLSYSNTRSNTWRVDHSVQHIYIAAKAGRVTKVKYEAHGSYGFGSTFYTTDAYSSVALP